MIYITLFLNFFKIGLFTFGGGYAMIPLIQDVVLSNKWMTMDEIVNFIAVSESTPGPLAINMATYLGYEVGGISGALVCTFAISLPSFIVILLIARAYKKFKDSKTVKGAMVGIKPAVVGLIGASILSVAANAFKLGETIESIINITNVTSIIVIIVATIMLIKRKHPIFILGASAIIGIVVNYIPKLISV